MRIFPRKGCVLLLLLSSIATLESRFPTFNQVVDLVLRCSPSMGDKPASQRLVNARARQAGSSLNAYPKPRSQTDGSGMEVTTLDVESSRRLGQKFVAIGAKEQAWRSMC